MIIADFLQISINLIFVATIIVCLLLLGIVLMQRSKQEGLGAAFGSALTDQAFGARTTDVLQKGTVYLGSLFMILCFVFSLLIVYQHGSRRSTLGQEATAPAPVAEAPAGAPVNDGGAAPAPVVPDEEAAGDAGDNADWIKKAEEAARESATQQAPADQDAPAPVAPPAA